MTKPPDGEALYDAYLDACLAGEPEEPRRFFERHPGIDTRSRKRIEALHRVLAENDPAHGRLPFERLGKYRLVRRLASGGMGTVYLAEQEELGRLVALKIIRPEFRASETAMRRFAREARAIAKLRHPNVVRVLELGEHDGVAFLAMEFVPGRPLGELLDGDLPHLSRVLAWMEQLARALDEAHREGIVHRDVKPSNILITPEDQAVLLDFGLAHLAETQTRLTRTFAGSPSYAAPEQLSDARVIDARTDVYGLGATLYECLAGRLPFAGESVEQIFQRVLYDDPEPLGDDVPPDVETVTLKALAKLPQHRYASMAAFADDLRALREARRIRARRPSAWRRLRRQVRRHPVRATAVATALAALAVFLVLQHVRTAQRARDAVAEAGRLVADYRRDRARSRELEARFRVLEDRSGDSYLSEDQEREYADLSERLDALKRRRAADFHRVLELLRRAERLDADVDGADAVRARLYLVRMEEAREEDDFAAFDIYRGLVFQHDPDGRFTAALRASGRVSLVTQPPGAAAELFAEREHRRIVPGGEPRFVPVPLGEVEPPLAVEPGDYHLVVRKEGCEDMIVPFAVEPGEAVELRVRLNAEGATPEGFVFVCHGREPGYGFWMQEREVTAAEYLEFLNDTRAAEHAPRGPEGESWPRGADGAWRLADGWDPRWPAIGVSWNDAAAYARWRSARDGRVYALPNRTEWVRAATGGWDRLYPFGNVFRPKWVNSCFSKPQPGPEPVQSYPIDRSCFGVYDLCGSASEWLDDWFDEARGMRRLAGGNWGSGKPDEFRVWAPHGFHPHVVSGSFGFRLVIRRGE